MKKIEEVYFELLEGFQKEESWVSSDPTNEYSHLKQSSKLMPYGKLVYDVYKDEYELINWPFKTRFYPKTGTLSAKSFQKLIHPDDRNTIAKGKLKTLLLSKKMTSDELKNHTLEFHCQIKNLEGYYQSMLLRYIVLKLDEEGDIKLIMLQIMPVSKGPGKNSICCLQLLDLRTEECIFKIGRSFFPKKRLMVLKKIAEDLNSKEIAEQLDISIHTVNGHRKTILEQTGCENICGAIYIAQKMGQI